jgi:dihydrofolate synthase/folylpolyglutamate synthase
MAAAPGPVSYGEALAWLYGIQRFGIKLGLENTQRLLGALKVPRKSQRVVHVAGTNGKGSVCAMIDAICRAQGYKTGMFTSPHLVTFRERIQVRGEMISENDVARGLTSIRDLIGAWDPHPTFFEITTALALRHFAERDCEIIILETGLGGRLDATNAVQSVVSVLTPIGLDHQDWLGETLEEVATEKAGIVKAGIPIVSARQDPVVEKVIRARARNCEAPLQFVTDLPETKPVSLVGEHQKQNAILAVAALRAGHIKVGDKAIAAGLANISWPARFQPWGDQIIIDGAHNPAAMDVVVKTWRKQFGDAKAAIVFGVFRDKDAREIYRILSGITGSVFLPAFRGQRVFPSDELAKIVSSITPDQCGSVFSSVGDAIRAAQETGSRILITGSLHLAGEALAYLRGEPAAFEECSQ